MHAEYINDFEFFLSVTNEKAVSFEEISQDIDDSKPSSMLDIGAGNGDLAIPLSKKVLDYTAIEKNPLYVAKLRAAGLRVIDEVFPTALPQNYDFILSSHSISYTNGVIPDFVNTAWAHLNQGGQFLIVTYRGEEDNWTRFQRSLGHEVGASNRREFNDLVEQLEGLGSLTIRKVQTLVTTSDVDSMIRALSFVASDGVTERKEQFMQQSAEITQILEAKYKDELGYSFPFQHFFLKTQKV